MERNEGVEEVEEFSNCKDVNHRDILDEGAV